MSRKVERLILVLLIAGTTYVVFGWFVWRFQLHWIAQIGGADYGFRQMKDFTDLILGGQELSTSIFAPTFRFFAVLGLLTLTAWLLVHWRRARALERTHDA